MKRLGSAQRQTLVIMTMIVVGGVVAWFWIRPPAGPSAPTLDIPTPVSTDAGVVRLIKHLRSQTAANPASAEAWANLGRGLEANDLRDAAVVCYTHALSLGDTEPRTRYRLAMTHLADSRIDDAIGELSALADAADASTHIHLSLIHI